MSKKTSSPTAQDALNLILNLPASEQRRLRALLSCAGWELTPPDQLQEWQEKYNDTELEAWKALNTALDGRVAAQRNCEGAKKVGLRRRNARVAEHREAIRAGGRDPDSEWDEVYRTMMRDDPDLMWKRKPKRTGSGNVTRQGEPITQKTLIEQFNR